MPTRFVIPATAKPGDKPYAPRRQITWQQIADEAGAAIANLGDQWCTDYGIDGLGLASPRETLAERAAREAAQQAAGANRRTVEDRARAALTANATFRALQSPTNAQVLAQVRRLTAQSSALIRLMLNELDTIDDTNGT